MSSLATTLTAVTNLAFVADAYPYKDPDTIVVILKPELRKNLPLNRSTFTFHVDMFSVDAVIDQYEREVVLFLVETLRTAEQLLAKSTRQKITRMVPLCLN